MPKAKAVAKTAVAKAADNKLKRKDAGTGMKQQAKKKAAKDPNKPKRPPTAFFVFMAEFREQFKKENPSNKSVAVVGKAGGVRWKSLSAAEKAPFIEKAENMKKEYEKTMMAYNSGLAEAKAPYDEESDKSRSEVNDNDDDDEDDEDDD